MDDPRQRRRGGGTFSDVLRIPEFTALLVAEGQSQAGDSVARVAWSVLVFQSTGSASLTALAYAMTFLPAIFGGALLSGLADRFPRRTVMITCDLIRAALLGIMALRVTPVLAVGGLVVVSVLVGPLFSAARTALLPQILTGERFVTGQALRSIVVQLAQLAGFALGGVLTAGFGPRLGLAVDAATFVVSAILVARFVAVRPAPSGSASGLPYLASIRAGFGLVIHDRTLRLLLLFGWLAAFYVVPEGLAAPYVAELGGGAVAIGLFLAVIPIGSALGAWALVRFVTPASRPVLIGPLAIVAGLALMLCAARPGLAVSAVLWLVCGVCCAYQVPAAAQFVQRTPDAQRGYAYGLAGAGLLAAQGLGIVAFGFIAEHLNAAHAVGVAGATAAAAAVVLTSRWRVGVAPEPRPAAGTLRQTSWT